MTISQGDLQLLEDPLAQELLSSTELARLAYSWLDGTPRVVPIWFHWTGGAITFGSPPRAPKLRALERAPRSFCCEAPRAAWDVWRFTLAAGIWRREAINPAKSISVT